jgi:hypothetical protein
MQFVPAIVTIYLAGVVLALWRTDAAPLPRLGLALLWPLAAIACVTTLTMLSAAALVLFPVVGLIVLGGAGAMWWYWR